MENNKPVVVFKNLATNNCGEKPPCRCCAGTGQIALLNRAPQDCLLG